MNRAEFIKKYQYHVLNAGRDTTLLPSVFMAQAILESDTGNSTLAKWYNNFFGIKADGNWKGKSVNLATNEVISGETIKTNDFFRVYTEEYQSFKDRVGFLKANKRYINVFKAETPEQQAKELQESGYATDPDYANKLLNIINIENLVILDKKKSKMKQIDIFIAVLMLLMALLTLYKYVKL